MFRVFFYENCRGFEDIKDISDDYKIDDVELLKKKLFDDFVDVEIISSWFNENINDVNVDMVVDYDNEKGIGLLNISEELGVWFYKNEDSIFENKNLNDSDIVLVLECYLYDLNLEDINKRIFDIVES
jgi:hypothetical protein